MWDEESKGCVLVEGKPYLPSFSLRCWAAMDDLPLQKIAIPGPTLASMIQRLSSSAASNVDGLLFGHVTHITPSALSDDDPSPSPSPSSSTLVATITGFLCFGSTLSFYDPLGRVDSQTLNQLLTHHHHRHFLIGWFSSRRKTPLRPSLRESSVTASLSCESQFSFPIKNFQNPSNFTPCLFLLFATTSSDQLIHTHDYWAYQFRTSVGNLESKSIDIVNIGPAFRGQYESFSPNSPFPLLPCKLWTSRMNDDKNEESLSHIKQVAMDQKELDMCAEGFEVRRLSQSMGSDAVNYTAGLEELYEKMLAKIKNLATLVEQTSAKVLEQENHNRKLRHKIAGS